uniref:Putative secreted protein n=1 Tax=Ixodes ricinus TaxID=34613 RepID=A0A6B0U4Z3_IXORI
MPRSTFLWHLCKVMGAPMLTSNVTAQVTVEGPQHKAGTTVCRRYDVGNFPCRTTSWKVFMKQATCPVDGDPQIPLVQRTVKWDRSLIRYYFRCDRRR